MPSVRYSTKVIKPEPETAPASPRLVPPQQGHVFCSCGRVIAPCQHTIHAAPPTVIERGCEACQGG